MWNWSVRTSGYCADIALKRSSQYGIVIAMPLDLVADVRCARGRVRASSNANLRMRSTPLRVNTDSWNDDLALGALEHAAADRRILALGVLAHDDEVDVAGLAVGERRRDARHQPAGPQVDVLVEAAPELDQRAPQRDVVGHRRRPADGAVEDRLEAGQRLEPVLRHHAAGADVVVAVPVEMRERERDAEPSRRPSRARAPSGTDSLPMPSPGMTAMRCVAMGSSQGRPLYGGPRQRHPDARCGRARPAAMADCATMRAAADPTVPMKQTFLDFEQPIAELQAKIDELRYVHEDSAVDISDEIARLTKKSQQLTKDIYGKLTAWQIAQVARHPQRPYTLDYIDGLFTRVPRAARRPPLRRRSGDRRRPRALRRRAVHGHRPPEGPRHQGEDAPQLRHAAARGLPQGAAR